MRGDSTQFNLGCEITSERYLAAGLGSTSINPDNSELWDSSVTSLEALHPIVPGTLLYNGVDASLVGDLGPLALSSSRQFEGSVPGQFVYEFRANSTPDVATPPGTPVARLESATQSSISVIIEPPSYNGGAPVLTYGIEYRIAGESDWTPVPANIQYAEPNVTFEVGGLAPATNYEVRVTANNGIGDSEPTETISLSTTAIQGAPETPNFSSPNPFEKYPDGSIGYSIELLSPLPDSMSVRYRPVTQEGAAAQPWITKTLPPNFTRASTGILNPATQYEFQISAQNSVGSSAWSDSELVTTTSVDDRYLEAAGIRWNGYGSEIFTANDAYGSGLVYDGALRVFIGDSNTPNGPMQVTCDQSSINHPGFDVGVEGKQGHYEWETAETRVQGGYTVTCAPVRITLASGHEVIVSLSRFFFVDSPWTRVMVDVTNTEATPLNTSVWLRSDLQPGTSVDTTYEATSTQTDPVSPATGDRWIVTGDNKSNGMVVAHVFGEALADANVSDGVNQDGSDLMVSEFALNLPGTNSGKSNRASLAWFDGIVKYDVATDPEELATNYASAIDTAKAAAGSFTKVKSQQTDTYPRFMPPTLTNFRMPAQFHVSPGVFNNLKIARISGLDKTVVNYQLDLAAGYTGGQLPTTFNITSTAKDCIDNSLNAGLFPDNTEVGNIDLTVVGSQVELNCFLDGLTFSIPEPPVDALYGSLSALLSKNVNGLAVPMSQQFTNLLFGGVAVNQTLVDVEAGNATWRGVGTGTNDVETRSNRNAFDSGSLKVYWIPNINADPLTAGHEIVCPQNAVTQLTEDTKVKQLSCTADEVVTAGGNLSIGISRNFATSDPWQQLELNIINNGSGEIGGAIAYRLDLGSDENTQIEMTSDGDLNLESADSWFISSDNGQRTDPVLLHYVGYETGQKITRGTGVNADKIWVKTPLVVAGNGTQITKRYLEGVVDTPLGQTSDSVVIAMKAADDVANNKFRIPGGGPNDQELNILDTSLPAAVQYDRNLPALHTVYECRDYAHNALGPIALQSDGKVIGCDAFDGVQNLGPGGEGGPGSYSINEGLFPGNSNQNANPTLSDRERADIWANTFSSKFPNAQPRLGWACDECIMTREGAVDLNSANLPNLPAGLPLGFSTHVIGGTGNYDSVRILPQGVVQLHDSSDTSLSSGTIVSAFGNAAMSNGVLQGNWNTLPDYDFFYWGRTIYQGRVAFVITWVKIPTVQYSASESSGAQIGEPIPGLQPTSVQLMFVSDSNSNDFQTYMDTVPSARAISNLDLIWNYNTIQGENAQSALSDYNGNAIYSGLQSSTGFNSGILTDSSIESEEFGNVGIGRDGCSTAACVATELLSNKLQSPVTGRYVMGFRDYQISGGPVDHLSGFLAPAAPRSVQVSRTQADVAEVSWKAPKPWVLAQFNNLGGSLTGAQPILGYRIEYGNVDRGQTDFSVYPTLNSPPLLPSDLESVPDAGETRYSYHIPNLNLNEQYTFRVYATYAGLDLPEPATDWTFSSEVRGVPSLANEQHISNLRIENAAEGNWQSAQEIAGQIAGNIPVANATVNGSSYIYGITSASIGTFENGTDAIGIDSGLVLAPLLDVRTFERGSGIMSTYSTNKKLTKFTSPQDRARYDGIYTAFNGYMQSQKSWVPGDPGSYVPVCRSGFGSNTCTNGMTVLQFDVVPTANFLKFEYALAGTETTDLYQYPDGFGLFVGGIDQSHSCALVPQINETTPEQRFVTSANALEARLAKYVPFDSDLHAATITSAMTCSTDVSNFAESRTPVTVTMVIANANDQILSPAVFLKGDSIRFEPTSINARDIPAATIFQSYEPVAMTATGTAPTFWTAIGLPEGMVMTPSGEILGTPMVSGNFNFTVNALDESNAILASQAFSILVNPPLPVEDDRFLKGNYVEVGIGGNGHFGSAGPAPTGYHPQDPGSEDSGTNRIGFVSDRNKDGWGFGQDDGDFFVPGTPFEGFGIDVGGSSYFNNYNVTDIARLSEVTDVTSEQQQSTWTSQVMSNGLQVTQVSAVPINDQRLDVTVTLTNTSDSALSDVYYARQVDNDANVYSCAGKGGGLFGGSGGWRSLNTVESQASTSDGLSLVSSIMMDDCNDMTAPTDLSAPHSYLGMISTDPNSVAALQYYGNTASGFGSQKAIDFVNGTTQSDCETGDSFPCLNVNVTPGAQVFGDSGIGLGFSLGTIGSQSSKTITFSYILSPDQARSIIDQHNTDNAITPPALTANALSLSARINESFRLRSGSWLDSTGGLISYFTISPALPSGLSLDPITGDISGTPTEESRSTEYTITAHNLAGQASKFMSLSIFADPTPSASPTPTPSSSPTPTPSASPTPSAMPTPVPVIALRTQVPPAVPKTLKLKKTIKFTMKTKAGIALVVSSKGTCKTTKITVKKKVDKKFVKTQIGWLVTATKKGSCSIRFMANGDTVWNPLDVTKKTTIK